MANKRMKTLQLPGLSDTYTFVQADSTLTQAGEAADAKTTGDALAAVRDEMELITGCFVIPMAANKYVSLSGSTVTMAGGKPAYTTGTTAYSCGIIDCSVGDRFTINGTGGNATRLWGFVDASGNVLSVANSSASGSNLAIVAPADAAWLIIHTNDGQHSFAGVNNGAYIPITSSDDVNNIRDDGNYRTSGSIPTHWPVSYDKTNPMFGILTVTKIGNTVYQTVIDYRNNLYLRVYATGEGWSAWVQYARHSEITSVLSAIDSVSDEIEGIDDVQTELRSGYVYLDSTIVLGELNNSGNIYQDSERAVFDEYMKVGADSIVQFDDGYTGAVCLYDDTKAVIPGSRTTATDGIIRIPADTYFRVSIRTSPATTITDATTMAKKCRLLSVAGIDAYNAAAVRPLAAKIFKRVGCIGDSYTEGYINAGGEVQHRADYAWPHYMETLTGNVWTNFGVGGSSCKSWVENVDRYSKLSDVQAEGNKCQAYVIGLMINDRDSTSPNYVAVGTADDIGTDADSYYAYYYKLIEAVHAVNEDAPIFCNTCPKSSSAYIPYNQAVRDIVAYCQQAGMPVYLCDLEGDYFTTQYFANPVYTTDLINGHYTGIGYEMMAECYLRVLSEVILANVSAFQTVHMIDYDEPTA